MAETTGEERKTASEQGGGGVSGGRGRRSCAAAGLSSVLVSLRLWTLRVVWSRTYIYIYMVTREFASSCEDGTDHLM